MYKRAYKRKSGKSIVPAMIVFLVTILISALSSNFAQLVGKSTTIIIIIGAVGIFLSTVFIWYLNYSQKEKLKALQISDVDQMRGVDFEKYVAEILKFQGYKIQMTKITGDFGADIVALKNHDRIVIQLKRYVNLVGIEAVQQAVASMAYYKCNSCMVVTNNYFTTAAKQLANVNNCELINRDRLSEWIVKFQKKGA